MKRLAVKSALVTGLVTALITGSVEVGAPVQAAGPATGTRSDVTVTSATGVVGAAEAAAVQEAATSAAAARRVRRVRVLITSPDGAPILLVQVIIRCRLRVPRTCDPESVGLTIVRRFDDSIRVKKHKFTGVVFVGGSRFRMRVYTHGNKIVDRRAVETGGAFVRGFIIVPGGALRLLP